MKSKILSFIILISFIVLAGCEYDNYDQPGSKLTGTVLYNGKAVGVRSGGTQLELWQYGYQVRSKIPVNIAQDGTFTATVFDGNYKLVRLAGAPWANQTDSIDVAVNGNTNIDVQVTPYFTLNSENFVYTPADSTITGTVTVSKVGTANITSLTLYVGMTNIVDPNNNVQSTTVAASGLTDLSTPKTVKVKITNITPNFNFKTYFAQRGYAYARFGVLSDKSTERYYTPVQKITLSSN